MKIAHVVSDLAFAPQLKPEEIQQVAAAGFKGIVNNRPDNEEPGQPSSAEIQAAAQRCGLRYVHIPVVPGRIGDGDVAAFEQAMHELPGPLLAFCRSGMRAASLWALAEAKRNRADEIIAAAAAAGYDLQGLRPRLAAAAEHAAKSA